MPYRNVKYEWDIECACPHLRAYVTDSQYPIVGAKEFCYCEKHNERLCPHDRYNSTAFIDYGIANCYAHRGHCPIESGDLLPKRGYGRTQTEGCGFGCMILIIIFVLLPLFFRGC